MSRSSPALAALVLALLLAALTASPVTAKSRALHAPQGLAIAGYDPVAYFAEGKAVRGVDEHMLRWRGAFWHFTSAANLAAFEANPKAYLPAFGGYCATAFAEGRAVPGDPEIWMIHEGRLYLAASPASRDRLRDAAADLLRKAAAHWRDALR